MILSSIPFLPLLMALFGGQPAERVTVTRLTVSNEVILRVPVIRPRMRVPIRWVEKKGPKCIGTDQLVAAALGQDDSIDFLLRDRRRIRAEMDDDCPALDFYDGFYLQPEDSKLCARRDEIRSRMGGSCRIERFRTMVPTLAK